ncbi:hypothetical protein M3O96_02395 [Aquiflexum sp. TKW24L]|uniref:hypothetical protein n=1 Tax=Aquiflexum sp. TKW24L TaxID=2942212 RepID=UPI0020BD7A81|nr:hypothetical protein [Aquiflexum sp. TKW24L]MCL6257922.1 hypothetical protein [Aquiflexum sp. TKW24L]
MVKNMWIFTLVSMFFWNNVAGQQFEKYQGVTYSPPDGWIRDEGLGYLVFTKGNPSTEEFGRILLYKEKPSSGFLDIDFEEDWKALIVPEYQPKEPKDSSKTSFKSKWNAMIGAAPGLYENQNQVVVLVTISNGLRKISYVFVTNTLSFEKELEEFGSSLVFGSVPLKTTIPPQNMVKSPSAWVQIDKNVVDKNLL